MERTSEHPAVIETLARRAPRSDGPESVQVQAFGRTYPLHSKHIRQLRGLTANAIQLSYERGYRELGGRTVYILFSKGFTSGMQLGKIVSVAERGDIKVEETTSH